MIPALLQALADGREDDGLPAPPTSAALMGPDRAEDAKVTLLLFAGGAQPVAVAKIARNAAGSAALRREHDALCGFWTAGSSRLRERMPRPLGLRRVAGRDVLLQSAVQGHPMTLTYYAPGHVSSPDQVRADFSAAAEWLEMFQDETRQGHLTVGEVIEGRLTPLLARYASRFGWGAAEDLVFGTALDRARAISDTAVPVTGHHGDYWMGNLMLGDAGRLTAAVDWEHGSMAGLPTADIYKFPTSYGFYLDRSRAWAGGRVRGHPERVDRTGRWAHYGDWRNLAGFRHAYFSSGWFPDLVREHVVAAHRRLGVPQDLTLLFFAAFLVEQGLVSQTDEFREGYRSLIAALAGEGSATWLWSGV